MANNNPDLSALDAYSGTYQPQLMAKFYKELDLAADGIQVLPGIKTKTTLTKLTVGKGLKPYTGKFVSMDGQLKYAPRSIQVNKAQRDIEIEPDKYRATYQGVLRGGTENAANKAIPFAQVVWDTVMKENAEEIVDMVYWGLGKDAFAAYSSGTAYAVGDLIYFTNSSNSNEVQYYKCLVATSAGENPTTNPEKWAWSGNLAINKGFNAIISDAIDDDGFDDIVDTGTINSLDAYNQFTAVWRKQKEQFKKKGANIYCSVNAAEMLNDALEEKVTKFTIADNTIFYLPKTDKKCIVKPVSWLSGSNRLICTPNNNLVLGTDSLSDVNNIQTIIWHYTLQASMTFVLGAQIADLDALTINGED